MRYESIELGFIRGASRARRTHLRGRGYMISKAAASLPTAAAMDEAIAGFDITDAKSSRNSVRVSGQLDERRPMKDSLMTSLAAQLEALDQQRQHLFELLQSIEE